MISTATELPAALRSSRMERFMTKLDENTTVPIKTVAALFGVLVAIAGFVLTIMLNVSDLRRDVTALSARIDNAEKPVPMSDRWTYTDQRAYEDSFYDANPTLKRVAISRVPR
jgi:hypothetical protein